MQGKLPKVDQKLLHGYPLCCLGVPPCLSQRQLSPFEFGIAVDDVDRDTCCQQPRPTEGEGWAWQNLCATHTSQYSKRINQNIKMWTAGDAPKPSTEWYQCARAWESADSTEMWFRPATVTGGG